MTDSKDEQIDQENRMWIGFNPVHFAIHLFSTKVSSQCSAEREDILTNDAETIQYPHRKTSKRLYCTKHGCICHRSSTQKAKTGSS